MATFHFTLKKDKKPDGTKVKALEHVEYISRKGAYAETDAEREKGRSSNNIITTKKVSNAYDGKEALLYTSQYGDILNTPDGIQVKHAPSIDTTCLALMLAHETMGGEPLVMNGSRKFKELCIDAAVAAELPIVFADEKMQTRYTSRLEAKENGRQRFRERGGIILDAASHHKPVAKRPGDKTRETLASFRATLSELSRRHVAGYLEGDSSQDGSVLLQNDGHDELDNGRTVGSPPVRRDFSRARRGRAIGTAKKIIKNIELNKAKIYASSHVEYINREKAFAKRGGCVYHAHRLPTWAKDDPVTFFRAADMYEGKGNCRYKKIEFALQNELTLGQNLEIIRRFIAENLADHYYAFAIHDKIGAMTDGTHNTHVHIMFSERLIDDCEKEEERSAKAFFSYPKRNAKTLAKKRQGGAPKSRKLVGADAPANILAMRESYANITNEMLRENGCVERIDHRSLKTQRQEAIMRGDTFLAKLLDRIPEKHIRPQAFIQPGNPEVEALRLSRKRKQEIQELLFQADQEEKGKRERALMKKVSEVARDATALMDTQEFEESEVDSSTLIGELRQNLTDAVTEFNKWEGIVVSKDKAERMAKMEMMTEDERELWTHYTDLSEQERQWKSFMRTLPEPKEDAPESVRQDFRQLVLAVEEKLTALDAELSDDVLQDRMIKLERSFDHPEKKAILQRKISKILFDDKHAKERLDRASDNLASATKSLRQVLFKETLQAERKDSYTARELYDIARRRYYGLKNEVQLLQRRIEAEEKKVISMERARKMAQDVMTKRGFREYRKALRDYQKREAYYKADLDRLVQDEGGNPADFEKRRTELAETRKRLDAKAETLAQTLAGLERIISAPNASTKLDGIAAGIIQKNRPQAERVLKLRKELVRVKGNLRHAQNQMNAARENLETYPNASYRVTKGGGGGGGGSGNSVPDYKKGNIILDALLGKEEVIPHVQVRLGGGSDDGMKDWMLLDEGTKEAIRKKKMWREQI